MHMYVEKEVIFYELTVMRTKTRFYFLPHILFFDEKALLLTLCPGNDDDDDHFVKCELMK